MQDGRDGGDGWDRGRGGRMEDWMDRAMGHHPQGKGLEGGVRVWVGEESGQVVWGQEKDRFSISDQGPEGVPEGSLESWRFVSYSSMRFIFEKESRWQPCGVWVEGPAS